MEGGLAFIVLDDKTLIAYHCMSKELIMKLKLKKDQRIAAVQALETMIAAGVTAGESLPKEFKLAISKAEFRVPLCVMVVESEGTTEIWLINFMLQDCIIQKHRFGIPTHNNKFV